MIAYDLKCAPHGHGFEGWFGSRADYERQRDNGMLACPICGAADIERALSVPNVGAKGNQRQSAPPARVESKSEATSAGAIMQSGTIPPKMREAMAKMAELQGELLKNSEWVGRDFTEQARAQHYGEAEKRQIHGEASGEEARELFEEGIEVMPVLFPVAAPEKKN